MAPAVILPYSERPCGQPAQQLCGGGIVYRGAGQRRVKQGKQGNAKNGKSPYIGPPMAAVPLHKPEDVSHCQHQEDCAGEIVIFKGEAGDKYPRHQLGQIAQEDEGGVPIPASDGQISHGKEPYKAPPAQCRIYKGSEAGAHALRQILEVIEYWPDIEYPLIPAG